MSVVRLPPDHERLSTRDVDRIESALQATALQLPAPGARETPQDKAERERFDTLCHVALSRLAREVRYRNRPTTRPEKP